MSDTDLSRKEWEQISAGIFQVIHAMNLETSYQASGVIDVRPILWPILQPIIATIQAETRRADAEIVFKASDVEPLERHIAALTAERDALRVALEFYADPSTYHACSFLFDPPTGGFDDDFDEGHNGYDRPMPGKTARAALSGEGAS